MRIKIWASLEPQFHNRGPYKALDIIERDALYGVGEATHYGPVISLPPFVEDDADQSVIVQLNPASLNTRPEESVLEKPLSSYDKIALFPIYVDRFWLPGDEPPPSGTCTILEAENLTVEDVSHMIASDTFSLWQQDCMLPKDTIDALQNVVFAIVHRYSATTDRDPPLEKYSAELINSAVACLSLVRPTRKSRAGKIVGSVKADGMLYPQGFEAHEPAEVPEVQKLFTIRNRDIESLRTILPEFLQLYPKDADGTLKDEYEPLRMAVQLYEQAYAIHYWKARHILWWAAIESLYGNAEDAAMARVFAFFGNKCLVDGHRCSIYEPGDVPSCYPHSSRTDHTLGEMVPLIYAVRNASAHGQKIPDSHFSPVSHPFGTVVGLDALAEAATFVIRKTVTEILRRGFRERFKDRDARENFWLYEYGLNGKQSKKRLKEMHDSLERET
jgi:hypothetical protein